MEQPKIAAKSQEKIDNEQKRTRAYESAKKGVAALFESYETSEERIAALIEGNKYIFQYLENPELIVSDLEACAGIKNKSEFVEAVFKAGKSIVDLKIDRPEVFVRADGEDREFIKVSDILSYGIDGNVVHIHVVPDEKVENIMTSFKEGIEKLAEIVSENKEIKTIEATSWIVAKHPRIMERLGFTLDGDISEELRQAHFTGSKAKIHHAHMTREDFLKRYLKQ